MATLEVLNCGVSPQSIGQGEEAVYSAEVAIRSQEFVQVSAGVRWYVNGVQVAEDGPFTWNPSGNAIFESTHPTATVQYSTYDELKARFGTGQFNLTVETYRA